MYFLFVNDWASVSNVSQTTWKTECDKASKSKQAELSDKVSANNLFTKYECRYW